MDVFFSFTGFADRTEQKQEISPEAPKEAQPFDLFLGSSSTDLMDHLNRLSLTWTSSSEESSLCRSYLFHIPGTRRSAPELVMAAHYVALYGTRCVLCINDMSEMSDMSPMALRDYNRARAYLRDLAKRERANVCQELDHAVRTAVDIARQQR